MWTGRPLTSSLPRAGPGLSGAGTVPPVALAPEPPAPPCEEELFLGLVLGGPQQGRWPGMASVCTACLFLTRGRRVLKQVCALPDTLPAGDGACVFSPQI